MERNTNVWMRISRVVKVPRVTTENDKSQFDFNLAKFINGISNDTKNITNLKLLKEFVKKDALSKYRAVIRCNSQLCTECMRQ